MKINLLKETNVRCVWPGAVLPLGENGNYLVKYFKQNYDINIEYLEETKTLPGKDTKGSRIVQIFNVQEDSIDTFDHVKSQIGALYAKEVVQSGEHRFYNERVYYTRFKRAEDELLKAGKISKEDVYKTKK